MDAQRGQARRPPSLRNLTVHPSSTESVQAARRRCGSGPAGPRHTAGSAYRCFLPDLAGFTDVRCAGPDLRHRTAAPALRERASDGHRPRYSGLRVQGTATSPSSTANLAEGVGFEPTVPCGTHALQACQFNRSCTLPKPMADHVWAGARKWRRGRDSNPRCLVGTQHFECCTFNRSDTPPARCRRPPRIPRAAAVGASVEKTAATACETRRPLGRRPPAGGG